MNVCVAVSSPARVTLIRYNSRRTWISLAYFRGNEVNKIVNYCLFSVWRDVYLCSWVNLSVRVYIAHFTFSCMKWRESVYSEGEGRKLSNFVFWNFILQLRFSTRDFYMNILGSCVHFRCVHVCEWVHACMSHYSQCKKSSLKILKSRPWHESIK